MRRFVKPVTDMDRDALVTCHGMTGHAVHKVGVGRLPLTVPVLASAAGYIACALARREELGQPHLLHR